MKEDYSKPVRIKPTASNMAVMLDLFCSCIETGVFPSKNSPAHHSVRWMVADSKHIPTRVRSKLKHRKPNFYGRRA